MIKHFIQRSGDLGGSLYDKDVQPAKKDCIQFQRCFLISLSGSLSAPKRLSVPPFIKRRDLFSLPVTSR